MIGSPARALAVGALAAAVLLVAPASPAVAGRLSAAGAVQPAGARVVPAVAAASGLRSEPASVAADGGEGGLDSDTDTWIASLVIMLPAILITMLVYGVPAVLVVGAGVGIWFAVRRRRRRATVTSPSAVTHPPAGTFPRPVPPPPGPPPAPPGPPPPVPPVPPPPGA